MAKADKILNKFSLIAQEMVAVPAHWRVNRVSFAEAFIKGVPQSGGRLSGVFPVAMSAPGGQRFLGIAKPKKQKGHARIWEGLSEKMASDVAIAAGFTAILPTLLWTDAKGQLNSITPFLGSRFKSRTYSVTKKIKDFFLKNPKVWAELVATDMLIMNTDRHGKNMLSDGKKLFGIDHANAFTMNIDSYSVARHGDLLTSAAHCKALKQAAKKLKAVVEGPQMEALIARLPGDGVPEGYRKALADYLRASAASLEARLFDSSYVPSDEARSASRAFCGMRLKFICGPGAA